MLKVKPKIKCNMLCINIFYIHVMKVPKVAPLNVFSPTSQMLLVAKQYPVLSFVLQSTTPSSLKSLQLFFEAIFEIVTSFFEGANGASLRQCPLMFAQQKQVPFFELYTFHMLLSNIFFLLCPLDFNFNNLCYFFTFFNSLIAPCFLEQMGHDDTQQEPIINIYNAKIHI